jgi:ribosomal protein S18 acetylase RimI-like enzyme
VKENKIAPDPNQVGRSGIVMTSPDDLSLHSRLKYRTAVRADLPAMEWDGQLTHFRRLFSEIFRQVERDEAVIWLAELGGNEIVGQLFVHLHSQRPDLADGELRAYMYGFRVRSEYQNKGIGARLLEVAEKDLRQRGFRYISLNVNRKNSSARRLYERSGYVVIAPDPGKWSYIDHKGQLKHVSEPSWRMQKILW